MKRRLPGDQRRHSKAHCNTAIRSESFISPSSSRAATSGSPRQGRVPDTPRTATARYRRPCPEPSRAPGFIRLVNLTSR